MKRSKLGTLLVVSITLTIVLLVTLTYFPSSLKIGPLALKRYTFWIGWGSSSGTDMLENVVLFIPLGMSAAAFFEQWAPRLLNRLLLTTVGFCFVISYGIEVLQTVMSARFPSMFDVIANTIGGWIGCQVFIACI